MFTIRKCGCKGTRTCLLCEAECGITPTDFSESAKDSYVYCPHCTTAWTGWNVDDIIKQHPDHTGKSIDYPGVYIDFSFLSDEEERFLLHEIDNQPWDLSQSGRRKQNYGPKCNFKKRKLRVGEFNGFPKFSKFVQDRLAEVPLLEGFRTIEQCSLEYNPLRGASIDPHIDDCWIWGERIVTVNLMSDSVLTMTVNKKVSRYNLECVRSYPKVLDEHGRLSRGCDAFDFKSPDKEVLPIIVRIPMPRKSLLVIYGSPRYEWEHQVLREDISTRRVCLAYREFTPPYLCGGKHYDEGKAILEKATNFWD